MEYLSRSVTETEELGARLAAALAPGAVVAYKGGLGMGKTAFTRGLARGLGYTGHVTSPTFTIVNEYPLAFIASTSRASASASRSVSPSV